MPSLNEFRFPSREAEIFGVDEDGNKMPLDDQESALDLNQRAVEDYLNNTLPQVFIQQSDLASGTIDPSQLATGTPGASKAPVGNPPAWTDIATQAELDAVAATITAHPFGANDLQRGRIATGMTGTNTVFSQTFGVAFSATPRVTATIESGAGIGMFPTITAVNTTSFAGFIFASSSTTATCAVHWHAVKA